MNTENILIAVRDAVYNRFVAKQAANCWTYNNSFTIERTWIPFEQLDKFVTNHPTGKVYIIGQAPSDLVNQSRANMGLLTHSIQIGFQKKLEQKTAYTEIDPLVKFVGELMDACRLEVDCDDCHPEFPDLAISFSRIEFLKSPEGLPLSFTMLRQTPMFEAYFTAFYHIVAPSYESTTSTTTTTTSTTTTT